MKKIIYHSLVQSVSIGNLCFHFTRFSSMVSTQENRVKFIQSTITLLRTYSFDGINLDWRDPRHTECHQDDKVNFTLLCKVRSGVFRLAQSHKNVTSWNDVLLTVIICNVCAHVPQELKEAFLAEGTKCDRLIVTATVSAERKTINNSYEVAKLAM